MFLLFLFLLVLVLFLLLVHVAPGDQYASTVPSRDIPYKTGKQYLVEE